MNGLKSKLLNTNKNLKTYENTILPTLRINATFFYVPYNFYTRMTTEEKYKEIAVLIAIGKLYSEQATYLTKELKQRQKQLFNHSVNAVDLFVKQIENQLQQNEIDLIQSITDEFHNAFNEIRK